MRLTTQSIIWRSQSPAGGRAVIRVGGARLIARWSERRQGWVARAGAGVEEGDALKVSVRDRFGNNAGRASKFALGGLQRLHVQRVQLFQGGRLLLLGAEQVALGFFDGDEGAAGGPAGQLLEGAEPAAVRLGIQRVLA